MGRMPLARTWKVFGGPEFDNPKEQRARVERPSDQVGFLPEASKRADESALKS